jgi:hypothetical protein
MIRSGIEPSAPVRGLRAIGFSHIPSPALAVKDRSRDEVARVHIARMKRFRSLIDLVVDIEEDTPDDLRMAALASALIADREIATFGEGGG